MENFYLICPIGLEKALLREIQLKGLDEGPIDIMLQKGGLEVQCPLKEGLALNYHLRGATRVLLRVKDKKCRDFPKLFKTIGQIDWQDYLVKEEVEWRITSHKSRIIHTDKAKKTCEDALKKYFKGQPLSKARKDQFANTQAQKVFLRFSDDHLTISLDTSGDLLHIRGNRSDRGKASLRENYASLLLTTLLGSAEDEVLIDPMCGTGTFLYEALDYYRSLEKKSFPFKNWKIAQGLSFSPSSKKRLITSAIGLDIDPKVPPREGLEIKQRDFFAPLSEEEKKNFRGRYLICNLPYGKRVKISGERKKYFKEVIEIIKDEYRPKRFGVIAPADISLPIKTKVPFNNNGIKVNFYIE